MADRYELASAIFGTKRAETDASNLSSAIITGTAVEDSEEGVVKIVPDGNVIAPDGEDNTIILPTSPNVKEGDNVIIISTGGTATTPIVTGASGSGDRIVSELNTLLTDVEGIETLIREYSGGVLVAKVGNGVGALVNADGSFDVVSIAWSDGQPIVGAPVASFGSEVVLGRTGIKARITQASMTIGDADAYLRVLSHILSLFKKDAQIGGTLREVFHVGAGEQSDFWDAPFLVFGEYDGTEYYGDYSLTLSRDAVAGADNSIVFGSGSVTQPGDEWTVLLGEGLDSGEIGSAVPGAKVVIGRYNDAYDAPFVIGGGSSDSDRRNLLDVDWQGNLTIAGELDGTVDWSNIVNAPSMQGGVLFGKVDATSTATAFTATVEGLDALVDGAAVYLTNGVVTSAANFTININGLGAKPVYTNLAAATAETTKFNVNYSMLFIYNSQRVAGGCWDCYNGYDSNTNTIGYQLRTNSGTMVAADKGYRYRLWFTSTDGSKWVPANTSTSTNATANRTLNQRPIDPFGAIVYYSTNGTTNAGAALAATTQWQQYTLTIGYSYMQSGFSLTANEPVYVQCTPQSDGSAIMNSIVQALPTTDDGKIYIFLGIAYSATNLELRAEHPVYYFKDGAVRPWTNQLTTTMDAATNADILAIFA